MLFDKFRKRRAESAARRSSPRQPRLDVYPEPLYFVTKRQFEFLEHLHKSLAQHECITIQVEAEQQDHHARALVEIFGYTQFEIVEQVGVWVDNPRVLQQRCWRLHCKVMDEQQATEGQ